MKLVMTTAMLALASAAAPACTQESLGSAYLGAIQQAAPAMLKCTMDIGVPVSELATGNSSPVSPETVDKFTKSPNCVAVFTTIQTASKAENPPCTIGTMCGKSVTTAQVAAMTYDQYVHANLQTVQCTIPDPSTSDAPTMALSLAAVGVVGLLAMM
ncbi:hypothetical protein SPRG_14032 [Saprolegnia parasitica CBS 223.65]|uniref:Secreted protein n=1 Tax=Saprolegnia parasitica (strain CBS 223.65) TaxID=695850 RepID=A0A067C307_SAPPC|nr:hypothetical protein SPRG_14032 [Saprolegnia parasitica CBS 223.65]KDO20941.1 hypothetical protein SPRG_14032 [Saprolegnia parasitica CBS 223.65]|eukprot:XP_012208333.1 hypothetical protein SPRG_14032 [Saprolegnia parasitica CBS 223.65]